MIEIRAADPAEAPTLTAIALAAKRHWGYPEAWIAAWTPQLTLTADLLRERPTWVATHESEIIGFVALTDSAPEWGVEHLWILPVHQGRGTGRRLLETALDHVARRRPGRVRIESDPNAVAFYERCGARRAGSVSAPVLGTPRELPVLVIDVPPAPLNRTAT
jgi:GNAT superfamily N-acetyltransferase